MKGKVALIIAGGQSASALHSRLEDIESLREFLHIFVINNYVLSELGAVLFPNFVVFSDPAHSPAGRFGLVPLETSKRYPEAKFFVPRHWRSALSYSPLQERVYFFEDRNLEGWGRSTDPTTLRRFMSLTSFKAMAIARYMGYDSIFLIGLDLSMHKGVFVGQQNEILEASLHHPGAETNNVEDVSLEYAGGMSDYFYDLSLQHLTLGRFFSSGSFYNLGVSSELDQFRRVTLDDFFKRFRQFLR